VGDDFDVILSEGESYMVEFKEGPDKGLPAEVCAFANASGGRVYIGVHDEGYVVGTDTSNAARSRIQDTINKIEPRLDISMDVLDSIIVLTVPEGMHKPYSCPAGFYLRSGPNSQKLDRDSIIEFFQNEGRVRYDEIVRADLPIDARFNEAAYKRYIKTAKISDVLEREAILKNRKLRRIVRRQTVFHQCRRVVFQGERRGRCVPSLWYRLRLIQRNGQGVHFGRQGTERRYCQQAVVSFFNFMNDGVIRPDCGGKTSHRVQIALNIARVPYLLYFHIDHA